MKKDFKAVCLSLAILSLIMMPTFVFAQDPISNSFEYGRNIGGGAFGTADLRDTIVGLVNVVLGFLGIIAVIVILWGGVQWLLAGGNEENVAAARQTLISGIIGLAIIIASFSIAQFAITSFSESTGGAITF